MNRHKNTILIAAAVLLLCGAIFVGGVAGDGVSPTPSTITFDNGSGSTTTQAIPTGSGDVTVQLNPCGFTEPSNQKFIGWKKGESTYYTDRQSIKITSAEAASGIVLTAQWAQVTPVDEISDIESPITGQKYYKLTTNVTGNVTVNSGALVVLDLNGHVLNGGGSGSVITNNGVLTVTDSSSGKYHYFIVQDAGNLWVLDDTQASGTPLDQITDASQLVAGTTVIKVTGGCITGGTGFIPQGAGSDGGGVYVTGDNSTFTLSGGNIVGNTATNSGGGVYVSGGTFTLSGDANITGNTASGNETYLGGGGVYVTGDNSTFTMEGTASIKGNTAENGGGVCVYIGKFEMKGTASIKGNTAKNGGGVYVNNGTFTMEGTASIEGNKATSSGGGVYVTGDNSTFTMEGTASIKGNKATNPASTACSGGGVYVNGGTFTMNNGSIVGNTATSSGGGVYTKGNFKMYGGTIGGTGAENTANNGGGVYVTGANSTFTMEGTVSIEGNTATTNGGGVYVTSNGTFTLNDGSIAGNEATKDGGGVYVYIGKFEMKDTASIEENTAQNGGGVYVIGLIFNETVSPGTFTMEGSASIKGNEATGTADGNGGGGVYVAQYGVFTMTGGIIGGDTKADGNKTTGSDVMVWTVGGGGVFINGGSFTMSGTAAIRNNAADGDSHHSGGGVFINGGSSFTMNSGSSVTGNEAKHDGGGVFIHDGTFTMNSGSSITENITADHGGGVCTWEGTFTMNDGEIIGNEVTATDPSNGYGGGVYVNGVCPFEMKDGIISGNSAKSGGGVSVGGSSDPTPKFTMTGGEIKNNTATESGGGVFVASNGEFLLRDTPVISGNTKSNGDPNNVYLTNAERLKLTGAFTGEIYINNPPPEGGTETPFGTVENSATGAEHFISDAVDGTNHYVGKDDNNVLKWPTVAVPIYTITVTDDAKGKILPSASTAAKGALITLAPAPGYTMSNPTAYKTSDSDTPISITNNSFTMEDYDVTVTATCTANTYTVTLNANGGAGGSTSVTATYGAAMPSATMPTKTGYTFAGYYDATSGGNKYYNANGSSAKNWNKTSDTTLYAQWTTATYTVTIQSSNTSYGSVSPTSVSNVAHGTSITVSGSTLTIGSVTVTASPAEGDARYSYAFVDWKAGSAEVPSTVTGDLTITANFSRTAKTYTVTFNANGGTPESQDIVETYGSTYVLPTTEPTWVGHTFVGWFTGQTDGEEITSSTTVTITSAQTLYAHWTPVVYQINYLDMGGAAFSGEHEEGYPTEHTYGAATELKTATKTGYTFGGWFEAEDCSGTAVTELGAEDYTDNIPLYAKWTAIPRSSPSQGTSVWATQTYTVTFSMNGHGDQIPAQYVTAGSRVEVPVPAPAADGFVFSGWYTDQGCTVLYDFSTPVTSDLTLYAGWNAVSPAVPVTQTPAGKSPAPFAGVLAGLGAAAVVFGLRMRRK